jgi:hypothetical protein
MSLQIEIDISFDWKILSLIIANNFYGNPTAIRAVGNVLTKLNITIIAYE